MNDVYYFSRILNLYFINWNHQLLLIFLIIIIIQNPNKNMNYQCKWM